MDSARVLRQGVPIVFLMSSSDQICNVSPNTSLLEGKLRIHVMNGMMHDKTSKRTVLIYFMVSKKKFADAILVNICFRTLLISLLMFVIVLKGKEIYLVFTYKKAEKI